MAAARKVSPKGELKAMLKSYTRGTSASTRYGLLSEARRFAQLHGLDLPDFVQVELSRAARQLLDAYVQHCAQEGGK